MLVPSQSLIAQMPSGTSPVVAAAPGVALATRLTPPKRRADEAIGAFSEPSVSGEWLTVRSAMPAQDAPGALHIYRKSAKGWDHFQTLLSPDARPVDDGFGWTTAIDGTTLAVGAPDYELAGVRSGAVLVYRFNGKQWALAATIGSPDPVANGYFGQNVALDRGTLVTGEARNAAPGGWAANKAAYVFKESGGKWGLQMTLPVPAELAAMTFNDGSHGFGNHVDVDGNTVAVAARDQVYLYGRRGNTWMLQQRLDAPRDPNDDKDGPGFGRSLDLEGDTLVVAALLASGKVPGAGAAFVYRRRGGQWRQEVRLMASDGGKRDMFGHWVALDKGTIVSGAFRHAVGGNRQVGAAYVFRQIKGAWTQTQKVVPSDPEQQLFTGYGVAVGDGTVVMTAGVKPDHSKSDYLWTFTLPPTKG
ncbi:FG-GAP repeat protein [Sphingomonas sp. 32-62-10]